MVVRNSTSVRRAGFVEQNPSPNEPTKQFPVRDILTITTGRALGKPQGERGNRLDKALEALTWLTGEPVYTIASRLHVEKSKPHLYASFPQLRVFEAALPELDRMMASSTDNDAAIERWLAETSKKAGVGEYLLVTKVPKGAPAQGSRPVEPVAVAVDAKAKATVRGPEGGRRVSTGGAPAGSTVGLTPAALAEKVQKPA